MFFYLIKITGCWFNIEVLSCLRFSKDKKYFANLLECNPILFKNVELWIVRLCIRKKSTNFIGVKLNQLLRMYVYGPTKTQHRRNLNVMKILRKNCKYFNKKSSVYCYTNRSFSVFFSTHIELTVDLRFQSML